MTTVRNSRSFGGPSQESLRAAFDRPSFSALPSQPIASTGGGVPNNPSSSFAAVGVTTRNPFKAAVACTDLRLVFPLGFYLNSGGALAETAMGYTTPNLKAAIEYNGIIYPVLFRGQRLASIDSWGYATSDPIALEIKAGDVFYVRAYLPVGPGQPGHQGLRGDDAAGHDLHGLVGDDGEPDEEGRRGHPGRGQRLDPHRSGAADGHGGDRRRLRDGPQLRAVEGQRDRELRHDRRHPPFRRVAPGDGRRHRHQQVRLMPAPDGVVNLAQALTTASEWAAMTQLL